MNPIIEKILSENISSKSLISQGDFCSTYKIVDNQNSYFLKCSFVPNGKRMLTAEREGLQLLENYKVLKTPKIICYESSNGTDFLLMEYIEFSRKNDLFWQNFGTQLAKLHLNTFDTWGSGKNNFIGDLVQKNPKRNSMSDHLWADRFLPQIQLAFTLGYISYDEKMEITSSLQAVIDNLPKEKASLIHGDLWFGNFANTQNNHPIIYDPSANFSHREFDIAMMSLFGHVPLSFYTSYEREYPLKDHWQRRTSFFQSYYLLVHLNMFGLSYKSQLIQSIKKYKKPI